MAKRDPEPRSTTPVSATRPRSYAPVARSNSTSSFEQRVSATRWKADELKSHIPTAPAFQHGWLSTDQLDAIVCDYEAITNDPVRTSRKRDIIAACYRIHGADFLPFVADYFRTEESAQNLLGVLRRAQPRGRDDDDIYSADVLVEVDDSPIAKSDTAAAHTDVPCPVEVCLPGVIYCETHRPPFDSSSSRRYDRQPSDADATDDPDSGLDVG